MQLRADTLQYLLFVRQVKKVQYDALVFAQELTPTDNQKVRLVLITLTLRF